MLCAIIYKLYYLPHHVVKSIKLNNKIVSNLFSVYLFLNILKLDREKNSKTGMFENIFEQFDSNLERTLTVQEIL